MNSITKIEDRERLEKSLELNNINPIEINHGIKFSSVCSGKNIIIHGGGILI
jgi:hypothetical protein